jgi:hypothetical protein
MKANARSDRPRIPFHSVNRADRPGHDPLMQRHHLLPRQIMTSLPLHRGPHRHYNAVVMERLGQIERDWSARRGVHAHSAGEDALMRLALLQSALRRRLLATMGRRLLLNRRDPFGNMVDFSELDAMAEALWGATDTFSDELIRGAAPAFDLA